jgi:hypothetical protein
MMEEWRDVPGYEGLYQVSSYGKVRSLSRYKEWKGTKVFVEGQTRSLTMNKKGYLTCPLNKDGRRKHFLVHRIVALAFLPNEDSRLQLNHKNCIKTENHVDNLEWVDAKTNVRHAYENNRIKSKKGSANGRSLLTEELVREIKNKVHLMSRKDLGKMYNVSPCTINDIARGRNWTHV